MGSGKERKPLKNPSKKRKTLASESDKSKFLGSKTISRKIEKKSKKEKKERINSNSNDQSNRTNENNKELQKGSASEQQRFFLDQFQSAKGVQLSSLELESLKDTCIFELSQDSDKDTKTLGNNIKAAFGPSWKDVLCDGQLVEGKVDAGSPAVLIISSSALRSIELLRGFRSLTKECHAAKLFSKHMKVEEQISLLKNRVNIASGTPSRKSIVLEYTQVTGFIEIVATTLKSTRGSEYSATSPFTARIKKLIDTEALGLSRLQLLLLDMHPDVKGYSLFSLPQVRDEFWDLFKTYFYQRMVQGDLRICLYGPYQLAVRLKGKRGPPNE